MFNINVIPATPHYSDRWFLDDWTILQLKDVLSDEYGVDKRRHKLQKDEKDLRNTDRCADILKEGDTVYLVEI